MQKHRDQHRGCDEAGGHAHGQGLASLQKHTMVKANSTLATIWQAVLCLMELHGLDTQLRMAEGSAVRCAVL